MQTIINNDSIVIHNPSTELLKILKSDLSYTDKSKQYQLKKMSRNPWSRNSPLYKRLQTEVNGVLYSETDSSIEISASFFDAYKEHFVNQIDNRHETGAKIVCPWVTKPYNPRPYQEEAIQLMLSKYRGVINFATGLGKTLVATHFIQQYKKKALVICPSDSVAKQFYTQFVDCFGKNKIGFFGGGKKKINDITVAIAASATRNIQELKDANFGVVIFDEVHHTPASTFFDIAKGLASVGKIFGLTATDYRSDGKDIMMTAGCGSVIIRRDIKWGVENGFLAEPYFIVREIKTGGKDYKDDKLRSYKEHILNSSIMKSRIESDARSMMSAGKSVLILVDEVAHGTELAKNLNIPFATGEDKNSQLYVDQLNSGKIQGLIGTDGKIGEGSDTKNVDVLILANFVASKGPVIQCIGRALRKQGSKTKALILDYVPVDSTMLKRHASNRVHIYNELAGKVKYIGLGDSNET